MSSRLLTFVGSTLARTGIRTPTLSDAPHSRSVHARVLSTSSTESFSICMVRQKRYTKTMPAAVGKVRMASIHSAGTDEVHDVPMAVLIRPFPAEVTEEKVQSLMKTLDCYETADLVPPIDIVWIQGSEGGNYYYSFGGCNRYEAHRRLQKDTIRGKLIQSTIMDLRCYLGGSTPDLK